MWSTMFKKEGKETTELSFKFSNQQSTITDPFSYIVQLKDQKLEELSGVLE